jgi:hypothetical protein
MAYFAELDPNNVVLRVLSVSNDNCPDPAPDNEQQGIDFLASLGLGTSWKQTSYHGNFRKQYAGIGYTYDADADVFVSPSPFPSWSLDENYDWQAPVPYPSDGESYVWDEEDQAWIATEVAE